MRNLGLLFSERMIGLVFPPMRIRQTAEGMVHVNGAGTGGTTTLSAGNVLRMDEPLREIGIELDPEFEELSREVPASTAHQRTWSEPTRRLFEIGERLGLEPRPTPKMIDFGRCRRCGRCVLGCPNGAKWDSRRFLDRAIEKGARLVSGARVREVVIRDGRAVGVRARIGLRTVFFPADLVILGAGGLGTPALLERSGITCEPRLFVDPVLCVAAPWPGGQAAPRDPDALRHPAARVHHLPLLRLPQLPLRPTLAPARRRIPRPDDQARGQRAGQRPGTRRDRWTRR